MHVLIVNQLFVQNNKDNVVSLLRGAHVGKEERLSQTRCCDLKGSGKETELKLVLQAICATQIQYKRCQGLSDAEVGFSTVNM